MSDFDSLLFTPEFLESFADRRMTAADRSGVLKCLALLNDNERHPSLRIHELQGDLVGVWSASASLRLLFERQQDGKKRLLRCSKHYSK